MRSTAPFRAAPLAAAALSAVLLACGGGPPPEPPTPAAAKTDVYCPMPLVYTAGQRRPVRVRIENRTSDTLAVWLDRCWWHTWMASVPPGRYRQPELPDELVAFPEGLRFHVFATDRMEKYGIFTVPVDDEPILQLVLEDAGRIAADSLSWFKLSEDQGEETVGTFAVSSDEAGGYVAAFDDEGMAILTWSCTYDWRGVAMSVPRDLHGEEALVSIRRDEGGFEPAGTWSIQQGVRDAVVPPESFREALNERFGGSGTVDVLIDDGTARQVRRFQVEGLEEALATLSCWQR